MRFKKRRFAFQTFYGPQPLPHQYCGVELRTSLTEAGDGAVCGAKLAETRRIFEEDFTSGKKHQQPNLASKAVKSW